jgi:hypothetical protein
MWLFLHFDLAIVAAVLAADGVFGVAELAGTVLLGELGLDGRVRPVRGVGRIFDEGTAARKHSEDSTGTTVVLATVLFLVALSPGFRSRRVRFALLLLTGVVQHDETSGDSRALRRCPGLERPVH